MDAGRPVRVGIVGCGAFGRSAYVQNVADHPDVLLAALCDVDVERAEAAAREHADARGLTPRPAIYADYREMIDRERLDAVMIGTLANVRPAVALAALNAGAHVLGAKPMAFSMAEAETMFQAAERAGRLLIAGYNFRFRDDAQAMHRFIRDGGVGRPMFARAWSHESGVPTLGPHYVKAVSGGGALASTGVHVIDLAVWYLGCPKLLSVEGHVGSRFHGLPSLHPRLEKVREAYDVEDLATGYAQFADGVTMSMESVWLAPRPVNDKGVDVWGDRGYASLSPLRLMSWQDGDYADRTEAFRAGPDGDNPTLRNRREAHHFVDCVLGRAKPLITPEEMWTDQAIVEGIYAGRREFDLSP